jgi:Pentapeptide repeats (8 copies)
VPIYHPEIDRRALTQITVGLMTSAYGHSRADVRRWPDDPDVRRRLEGYFDYLDKLPDGSRTVASLLDGSGLDFRGADLSGLDFTEAALSEANLSGVPLVGADLYGAWLIGAVLRGADLSRCYLRKVQGRTCDAQDAVLRGADLERAEFEDADFRRADLRQVYFGRASLFGADLREADLRECVFGRSGHSTSFARARLADCRAEGAKGMVSGLVDVGADSPELLDCAELQRWFAERGAPLVEVRPPVQR